MYVVKIFSHSIDTLFTQQGSVSAADVSLTSTDQYVVSFGKAVRFFKGQE